jgi:hypothetical protein
MDKIKKIETEREETEPEIQIEKKIEMTGEIERDCKSKNKIVKRPQKEWEREKWSS